MTRIEHINITVPDIDAAISFLNIIAPDFEVRKNQQSPDNYRWTHIGNDRYYFALQEAHIDSVPQNRLQAYKNYGVNHIALIVSNLQDIEAKLAAAGYQRGIEVPIEKYRKRAYYYDQAGFEWELVEYMSQKPHEMYLYE